MDPNDITLHLNIHEIVLIKEILFDASNKYDEMLMKKSHHNNIIFNKKADEIHSLMDKLAVYGYSCYG